LGCLLDHLEKNLGPGRLCDETPAVGKIRSGKVRIARRDDETNVGPLPVHLASQFETIVSGRHVDVGEDDPNPVLALQRHQSFPSVPRLENLKPGFVEKLGSA
jgi:hypothetical protein